LKTKTKPKNTDRPTEKQPQKKFEQPKKKEKEKKDRGRLENDVIIVHDLTIHVGVNPRRATEARVSPSSRAWPFFFLYFFFFSLLFHNFALIYSWPIILSAVLQFPHRLDIVRSPCCSDRLSKHRKSRAIGLINRKIWMGGKCVSHILLIQQQIV
jgi:hypothetical protein